MPLKFRGALSKQAEPALSVTDSPGGVEPISIRILQGATSTTSVSTNFETDYRPWSEGCQLGNFHHQMALNEAGTKPFCPYQLRLPLICGQCDPADAGAAGIAEQVLAQPDSPVISCALIARDILLKSAIADEFRLVALFRMFLPQR